MDLTAILAGAADPAQITALVEMDDDSPVSLSASTLEALASVLAEQKAAAAAAAESDPFATENWALSQFHYDSDTARTVAQAVVKLAGSGGRVCCVSCPTLFRELKDSHPAVGCHLLEFDTRYDCRGDFTQYDYNAPLDVPETLHGAFAVVVADPPYLADECLTKTCQTVRLLLATPESHRLLLTGAIMRDVALRELGVRPVRFRPQHSSKLANEFLCYTSHDEASILGGWDPEFLTEEEP
jgi:EEF1A lysine methyltransferase 1